MVPEIKILSQIPEISAKKFPKKRAFLCQNQEISYQELHERSNQLSNALVKVKIKKGDRVGILLERSIESVISVYGILKAGAVFVPIDPTSPISRINHIINNCEIRILISSDKQKKTLVELSSISNHLEHIIGIESELIYKTISWDSIFSFPTSHKEINLQEDDIAYIMFTSGTTGFPKGIVHTHKSGMSYAKLSANLYELNHTDIIGNVAPLFFDQSTFGYFTAPLVGAEVILFSDVNLLLLGSLSKIIIDEKINILYSVPIFFIQLLDAGIIKKFKSLRWILYGGEPFPSNKINDILSCLPEVAISNIYGPAEVNQCTYYHVRSAVNEDITIPIGQVWDETKIKILNEQDQEVRFESGELVVHSSTMMRGYWKQENLNHKAFYHCNEDGKNISYYRTGDLVKYNENGELLFLGRKDRQIKIRGFRIELEEVENVINQFPGIKESTILALESDGEKQLLAAYSLEGNSAIEINNLIGFISKKLPKYSVPNQYFKMEILPRTLNGKIDQPAIIKRFKNESLII